jgi:hypothetical protein
MNETTLALIFVAMLWAHFIGDFICQSDYHAVNKSKNSWVLAQHVMIYIIPFAVLGLFIPMTLAWLAVNVVLHFVTDFISSRITSKLWLANKRHWFFVTIGADQSVHFTCLFLTYIWLV